MLPTTTGLAPGAALQHRKRHFVLGISLCDHLFQLGHQRVNLGVRQFNLGYIAMLDGRHCL